MPASTYDAISTVTLTSDIQQMTITNIPQNYQDLVIVIDGTSTVATYIRANFGGTSFASGQKFSYVETLASYTSPYTPSQFAGTGGYSSLSGMATRSQIFLNVLNYSSSLTNCSFIWETRQARNTTGYWGTAGGTWFNLVGGTNIAGGMSSLSIYGDSGNIAAGTTVSVYGLTVSAIKATGGDIIQTDGNYWYHAFTSSGSFRPQTSLTCDVLVVAGGGSGGWPYSGGGGAGGVAYYTSQALTTQSYAITIGAGAAGGYNSGNGQKGSNSSFGALTAAVGGGGGVGDSTITTARDGGSGGGGRAYARGTVGTNSGGTGTAGQGNNGGSGAPNGATNESGGGGGGAGAVGANATSTDAGAGGAGTGSYLTWLLATGLGVGGNIAGGGGGGTNAASTNAGAGGSGGGGAGASNDGYRNSEPGMRNTGGGSGGGGAGNAPNSPKSGGSGLVIVRYAV